MDRVETFQEAIAFLDKFEIIPPRLIHAAVCAGAALALHEDAVIRGMVKNHVNAYLRMMRLEEWRIAQAIIQDVEWIPLSQSWTFQEEIAAIAHFFDKRGAVSIQTRKGYRLNTDPLRIVREFHDLGVYFVKLTHITVIQQMRQKQGIN